jgi:hypothetical protein
VGQYAPSGTSKHRKMVKEVKLVSYISTIFFATLAAAMILASANAETFQYGVGGYTGSEDMFFWENTYGNQGGQPETRAYAVTQYLPVVKFDVSSIASGTSIDSATLKLWLTANTTAEMGAGAWTAHKMLHSFGFGVETEIWEPEVGTASFWRRNWTGEGEYYGDGWMMNPGPSYGPVSGFNYEVVGVGSGALSSELLTWVEFDITAMVQSWVDDASSNNGLIIYSHSATLAYFVSNENAIVANHPILDIAASIPPQTFDFELSWTAKVGSTYQVYESSDLENWSLVGSPILANKTKLNYTVSPVNNRVFYRLEENTE